MSNWCTVAYFIVPTCCCLTFQFDAHCPTFRSCTAVQPSALYLFFFVCRIDHFSLMWVRDVEHVESIGILCSHCTFFLCENFVRPLTYMYQVVFGGIPWQSAQIFIWRSSPIKDACILISKKYLSTCSMLNNHCICICMFTFLDKF